MRAMTHLRLATNRLAAGQDLRGRSVGVGGGRLRRVIGDPHESSCVVAATEGCWPSTALILTSRSEPSASIRE